VRRICELYPALQSFFMCGEKFPVMLKKWFSDPCSHLWLNVVNSKFPLFCDAVRKAEAREVTAVESCMILRHLKDKQKARKEENFVPVSVRELLSSLEEDSSYSKNQFLNVSHDFYSTALQHLNAWGVHFDDIHHAVCMLLKTVPQREKIKETVHFFSAKADVIAIDEDSLFDEISSLKAFVMKEKTKEWDMNNANTCERWSEVFYIFLRKWFLICNYEGWLKYLCSCQEVMLLWKEFSLQ
jgi:hypothetical protein